jgi:hypothetical protein
MYRIVIEKTKEGCFVVGIGCQTFFYATAEGMNAEIGNYVVNHDAVDQAYQKFQGKIHGQPAPDTAERAAGTVLGNMPSSGQGIGVPNRATEAQGERREQERAGRPAYDGGAVGQGLG